MPTVSACLITKDEETRLPACLSSLEGHVDEIVLVDTGSRDATLAIARSFGCRTFQMPWRDDFSAPRNLGLDHATGDWILYIDADERLSCATSMKDLLPARDAAALRVKFHPRHDMTPYAEFRLFRRDPRIRFTGAMHESMVPGIMHVCEEDGSFIEDCHDIEIFHDGYEGDQSAKHARNLPLLKQAILDDPKRVYLRFHLGVTLLELGQGAEAVPHLKEGMKSAADARSSVRARMEGSMCAQVLCAALLDQGDTEGALHAAERGLRLMPRNLALRWARARCLVGLKRSEEAVPELESLLDFDPDDVFDPDIAYEKSLFRADSLGLLGSAWFGLREYRRAADCFEEAARYSAEPREYSAKAALSRAQIERSAKRQQSGRL